MSIHGSVTASGGGTLPGNFEVQMIDNGGNGHDVFGVGGSAHYGDCSGNGVTFTSETLANGRAVVTDTRRRQLYDQPVPRDGRKAGHV